MTSCRADPEIRIVSSQKALRVPRRRIHRLVRYVARAERGRLAEVDLAVVGRREIARLNRRWLGHAGATDVISFDLTAPGEAGVSAQIVVCADVAVAQARRLGGGPQRELLLYIVHGLLHLLGYDDQSPPKARRMRARQEELLETFLAADRKTRPRR